MDQQGYDGVEKGGRGTVMRGGQWTSLRTKDPTDWEAGLGSDWK